jgi:bifunctional DNase/RNase
VCSSDLPIWIGPSEADAIAIQLQEVSVPRPLTHDLLRTMIDTLGGVVNSIVVNDLNNDTFYAKIILNVNGRHLEVDSRPSDAIALAVRVKVPIYAEESVLEKAGVVLDQEGRPVQPESGPGQGEGKKVDEAELKRMSAFKDFINTLDLDDLGKGKSS